jgi:hypothetical protein
MPEEMIAEQVVAEETPEISELVRDAPSSDNLPFTVKDEKSANLVIKKIIAARAYGERVKRWAEDEQRRAEREEERLLFLFGRQLETWAKTEIEAFKGKGKSINLPAGKLSFRKVKASLFIDDEHLVLTWAKSSCPSAVVMSEKLSKSELNAFFDATGEIPNGSHAEPEKQSFSIG